MLAAGRAVTLAQEADEEVVKIDTRLVSLEVLVTDEKTGERIDGLKQEDFEVTDDGHPQSLTFFGQGQDGAHPLALVLLTDVDLQSLSRIQLWYLRAALRRAIGGSLGVNDQVAVFSLSHGFQVLKPLGYDRQSMLELLTPTRESRQTLPPASDVRDVADGLLAAVRHVEDRGGQFRLQFVVISGKQYGAPQPAASDSMEKLLASGAVVNVIRTATKRKDVLDYICDQTGGEHISVRGTDYSAALEQVIENSARRYSLGFVPGAVTPDSRPHELRVTVRLHTALGRRGQPQVRARLRYIASDGSRLSRPPY